MSTENGHKRRTGVHCSIIARHRFGLSMFDICRIEFRREICVAHGLRGDLRSSRCHLFRCWFRDTRWTLLKWLSYRLQMTSKRSKGLTCVLDKIRSRDIPCSCVGVTWWICSMQDLHSFHVLAMSFEQLNDTHSVTNHAERFWMHELPHCIDHVDVCILVSFHFLCLPAFRCDPKNCELWFRRSSRWIPDWWVSLHFLAWFPPVGLLFADNAKRNRGNSRQSLKSDVSLLVDTLYGRFFRVRIVEIIARSVLLMIHFPLCSPRARAEHHPVILEENEFDVDTNTHAFSLNKVYWPRMEIITGMRSLTLFSPKTRMIRSSSL